MEKWRALSWLFRKIQLMRHGNGLGASVNAPEARMVILQDVTRRYPMKTEAEMALGEHGKHIIKPLMLLAVMTRCLTVKSFAWNVIKGLEVTEVECLSVTGEKINSSVASSNVGSEVCCDK